MKNLQALIFDVDGTLADTEKAHLKAFNQAFRNAGLDWHWSTALYGKLLTVTGGKERVRYFIDKFRPDFRVEGDLDQFIADLHADKTREYVRMMEQGRVGLRSGVERLLDEARKAGLRLAIATTTTPANVTALLTSTLGTDALTRFEVIGAGEIVPEKKPAPDIYNYVLDRLHLEAADCIAFEDSANGLHSALDAGLQVIVTTNDFTDDQDFTGAALVLNDMGEPSTPFKLLAGNVGDHQYLNIDLVRDTHAGNSQ